MQVFPPPSASDVMSSGTWTPALQGDSDNPVATYTERVGKYFLIGKLCFFFFHFKTTTMTKSTLTDELKITLPFTAANNSNQIIIGHGRTENGTPVLNGNQVIINPNTNKLIMANQPLVAARANLTYAVLSLGVLTNTITYEGQGCYEVA